jgi:hypothetical protein
MSIYVDAKYLTLISTRLPLFTKKKDGLWNARCILCGDSKTNTRKARGYFYRQRNDIFYKCHNCLASQHFSTFLKGVDSSLYKQYMLERYTEGDVARERQKLPDEDIHIPAPVFTHKRTPLEGIAVSLTTLPSDHLAVQYCMRRKIPVEKFDTIYFIERVKDIVKVFPQYDTLTLEQSRIVFPLFDEERNLTGVTMRALDNSALRYLTFTREDNLTQIFGLPALDRTQPIYVVEGPIDSLFLPNAIACIGLSFGRIDTLGLPKDKVIVVFDNQPKNEDVCRLMDRYIKLQFPVCIWPRVVGEKDINEMVLNGKDVQRIISDNTYTGLAASLKFSEWRKC